VLNRVIGGNPSEILGHLQSNGRVFLVNPMGVLFGQGSTVDVGSLMATTLGISDQDFLSGRYVFSDPGSGDIRNAGAIRTADGGFAVLAGAESVQNSGVIAARLGDVVLASGSHVTMDVGGNGLISFAVDQATLSQRAGVANAGEIVAAGGTVLMTAHTARDLVGTAVNNSGRVSASGIQQHGGDIWLVAEGAAADVVNSGEIAANGAPGFDAGSVTITADRDVNLLSGSKVTARGENGGDVIAVAGERLSSEAGSIIDARASGPLGQGGFVEMSGRRLSLGSLATVGRGGLLLLDPVKFTIHGGSGGYGEDSIHEVELENKLRSGESVYIWAEEQVLVENLGDNRLDGRNNGNGGSLTLQVTGYGGGYGDFGAFSAGGTGIVFEDLNDSIVVDDSLSLDAGNAQGGISTGALTAGRSIYLSANGGSIYVQGSAVAGNNLYANAGYDIFIADIDARGSVQINSGGSLIVGDIVSSQLTDALFGYGSGYGGLGGISINSGGMVSGGNLRADFGSIYIYADAYSPTLQAFSQMEPLPDNGVRVESLSAGLGDAFVNPEELAELAFGPSSVTVFSGRGDVHVSGEVLAYDQALGRDSADAAVTIDAPNGSVVVGGDVTAIALAGQFSDSSGGSAYASVSIHADQYGGVIRTGNVGAIARGALSESNGSHFKELAIEGGGDISLASYGGYGSFAGALVHLRAAGIEFENVYADASGANQNYGGVYILASYGGDIRGGHISALDNGLIELYSYRDPYNENPGDIRVSSASADTVIHEAEGFDSLNETGGGGATPPPPTSPPPPPPPTSPPSSSAGGTEDEAVAFETANVDKTISGNDDKKNTDDQDQPLIDDQTSGASQGDLSCS
jgi:large exoprotein involved in heme utilization and adhesion